MSPFFADVEWVASGDLCPKCGLETEAAHVAVSGELDVLGERCVCCRWQVAFEPDVRTVPFGAEVA